MSFLEAVCCALLMISPFIVIFWLMNTAFNLLSDDMHRQYYEDRKDLPYFKDKAKEYLDKHK